MASTPALARRRLNGVPQPNSEPRSLIADTLLEIYVRFAELGRQELARRKAIDVALKTPNDIQSQEDPLLQSKR